MATSADGSDGSQQPFGWQGRTWRARVLSTSASPLRPGERDCRLACAPLSTRCDVISWVPIQLFFIFLSEGHMILDMIGAWLMATASFCGGGLVWPRQSGSDLRGIAAAVISHDTFCQNMPSRVISPFVFIVCRKYSNLFSHDTAIE